jgi:hypothetical protein
MTIFSSPARHRPSPRFGFVTLAFVVVIATALYGFFLNTPWPA